MCLCEIYLQQHKNNSFLIKNGLNGLGLIKHGLNSSDALKYAVQ
jgi:hypothetical protein